MPHSILMKPLSLVKVSLFRGDCKNFILESAGEPPEAAGFNPAAHRDYKQAAGFNPAAHRDYKQAAGFNPAGSSLAASAAANADAVRQRRRRCRADAAIERN
jgi:hypothetical protein